tara:strand:- start:132 stop:266 length:135 start_codon:yes stop_codon:yes gene_type:complete
MKKAIALNWASFDKPKTKKKKKKNCKVLCLCTLFADKCEEGEEE